MSTFNKSTVPSLSKLLNENTPMFKIERSSQIIDEAHILISDEKFQSTNTKIFEHDVLIDPDNRRYIVIHSELLSDHFVKGEVTTESQMNRQKMNINVGGNAVIGDNNNAFNTTVNHNISTITNEIQQSDLSEEDKLELTEMINAVEKSLAVPKGFLGKFANFFETHPQATSALGNVLTRVIIGTQV